eukprot:366345-Chlamydomonas_euryale.AAC.1
MHAAACALGCAWLGRDDDEMGMCAWVHARMSTCAHTCMHACVQGCAQVACAIASAPALSTLRLARCDAGDDAVEALCAALEQGHALTSLDLGHGR